MGSGKSTMSASLDPHLEERRRDAIAALNNLIEIENQLQQLTAPSTPEERARIAYPALTSFMLLSHAFHRTVDALIDMFPPPEVPAAPSTPDDIDAEEENEGYVTNELWRETAAFLINNHVPLPRLMSAPLSSALLALNDGEVQDLVKASVTGRRTRAWTLCRLQLAAFAHVYYLAGQGYRVHDAREMVAREYGYHENGANTVRSWANRELKKAFGEVYLSRIKEVATLSGKHRKNEEAGNISDDIDQMIITFEVNFRISPLQHCGELYRAALQGGEVRVPMWLQWI